MTLNIDPRVLPNGSITISQNMPISLKPKKAGGSKDRKKKIFVYGRHFFHSSKSQDHRTNVSLELL